MSDDIIETAPEALSAFVQSLHVMWKGMLALFIFAIFVMLITIGLKFIMRKKEQNHS
jgi:hypothetical protein